jgi:hypothetical protein
LLAFFVSFGAFGTIFSPANFLFCGKSSLKIMILNHFFAVYHRLSPFKITFKPFIYRLSPLIAVLQPPLSRFEFNCLT